MTLLWDGSFHGNEKRISKNSFESDGQYGSYCCLSQPNSFSVVSASSLPGGRIGYAGKFYNGVGSAYECNSNQHNLIIPSLREDARNQDRYYGFSIYIHDNIPYGGFGINIHGSEFNTTGMYGYDVGITYQSSTEASLNTGQQSTRNSPDRRFSMSPGKWYDIVVYVYWTTGNGIVELYMRTDTDSDYVRIKRFNVVTMVDATTWKLMEVRIGAYTDLSAKLASTIYLMNPKIGTTFEDVSSGVVHIDEIETWACEFPLNGYERSNLGNRRANPACNKPDDTGVTMTIVKEWNNIKGRIQTTDAIIPLAPGFTVTMNTTCDSIASGTWAQIISREYCWDIGITPSQYNDNEALSGKLFFSYEDIKDMFFPNIDMRQYLGQKVHIAVVVRQTSVDAYLNGIYKGSVIHTGAYSTHAALYPGETYDGVTEYVRIYDKELTLDQIKKDMTGLPDPEPEPQSENSNNEFLKSLMVAAGTLVAGYIIQKK